MLRNPNEIVTASNASSANGSRSASAATNGSCRRPLCRTPARSMPSEKSLATARAPDRASSAVDTPVPAAMSSTRSPGRRPSASRVRRRQRRSWAKDSTVLVRS